MLQQKNNLISWLVMLPCTDFTLVTIKCHFVKINLAVLPKKTGFKEN